MADKIAGYLEVGTNDNGEVVVNHPDLKPDESGVGHIVFSPNQARNLAELLMKHASKIDRKGIPEPEGEYCIAFYTKDCPQDSIDCVRVRIDLFRQNDMNKPMNVNLCEHPLYGELKAYVRSN